MILYLQTKSGKYYVIHDNGDIERTDQYHEPSSSWTLVGLHGQGKFVLRAGITAEWLKNNDVRKYTVRTRDHGSLMEWTDTLVKISVYNTPEDTNYYQNSRRQLQAQGYGS